MDATFQDIKKLLNEDIIKDVNGVFAFDLKGVHLFSLLFFTSCHQKENFLDSGLLL